MFKKIGIFICSSFIIGNTIAWFSGAAPIEFGLVPYSLTEQDQISALEKEREQFPLDVNLMVELGSLYSMHNDLDKARSILQKAVELAPTNASAIAWYNANETKQSGAMIDLTMGIYKLVKLKQATEGVTEAVTMAPDDLSVRMVRLTTFAFVGDINSQFELVFDDEDWMIDTINNSKESLPPIVYQSVYISMAHAYWVQYENGKENALKKSQQYLEQFNAFGDCPLSFENECSKLANAHASIKAKA
jgi:tetratricopeptide (TPR) repeat protein